MTSPIPDRTPRYEALLRVVEAARAHNDSTNSLGRRDLRLLHELDNALAALDGLPCDGSGGWRAIDSAPTDGLPILSYDGDMMAVIVWCGCKRAWFLAEEPGSLPHPESARWEGATHWQPLPSPPADSKEPPP